jgi:hypothetical protein
MLAACTSAACGRQDAPWQDAQRARDQLEERREAEVWSRAERLRTPEAWQRYLAEWPEGRHSADARSRLMEYVPVEPAGSSGSWSVQLGAFSDEAAARAALRRYASERTAELSGTQLVIKTPNDFATDVWRLRTTLLPEAAARDLCARLRAEGVDCVPVVD